MCRWFFGRYDHPAAVLKCITGDDCAIVVVVVAGVVVHLASESTPGSSVARLLLAILAASDNSGSSCLTAMACCKALADACSQELKAILLLINALRPYLTIGVHWKACLYFSSWQPDHEHWNHHVYFPHGSFEPGCRQNFGYGSIQNALSTGSM